MNTALICVPKKTTTANQKVSVTRMTPQAEIVSFTSPESRCVNIVFCPNKEPITHQVVNVDAVKIAKLLRDILPQATYSLVARAINNDVNRRAWEDHESTVDSPNPVPPKPSNTQSEDTIKSTETSKNPGEKPGKKAARSRPQKVSDEPELPKNDHVDFMSDLRSRFNL